MKKKKKSKKKKRYNKKKKEKTKNEEKNEKNQNPTTLKCSGDCRCQKCWARELHHRIPLEKSVPEMPIILDLDNFSM